MVIVSMVCDGIVQTLQDIGVIVSLVMLMLWLAFGYDTDWQLDLWDSLDGLKLPA